MASSTAPDRDQPDPGTVGRVTAVLALLGAAPADGLSVRGAAEQLGVSRSAVHRILAKLVGVGFARQVREGRYAAGVAFYQVASDVVRNWGQLESARDLMTSVVQQFDETVYLTQYISTENRLLFVDAVETSKPVKYVVPIGSTASLHAGAAGKCILAFLPSETLDLLNLERYTDNTPVDKAALRLDLQEIRERGYAISRGERIEEAAGVAAAIIQNGRPVGSLSCTIPQSRLDESLLHPIGTAIQGAARLLGQQSRQAPPSTVQSA
jgi:IclR family acetate operon transcriptional repressor